MYELSIENSSRFYQSLTKQFAEARQAARQLILYRGLLKDKVINAFLSLLDLLAFIHKSDTALQNILQGSIQDKLLDSYHDFFYLLVQIQTPGFWPDAWQRYLARIILQDENPFSRKAEWLLPEEIDESLIEVAKHDLRCLQKLFQVNTVQIKQIVEKITIVNHESSKLELADWSNLTFSTADSNPDETVFIQNLAKSTNWSQDVLALAEYYHRNGTGVFARFRAYRWDDSNTVGSLKGITDPDPITFHDLIDYQSQREQLIKNTEHFLAGLPASHVLLYGKRGTGKSSMVKALLNQYHHQGLRLIELSKDSLHKLPHILHQLKHRAFRFIIFIDDLSFEDYEVAYKDLKGILDGKLETTPANVLIYATSNRRHLVKELFSDRSQGEEIHYDDTVQEKLSLADRFGLTIYFPSPSHQVFLKIINGLAKQRNITLNASELQARALEWGKRHNGRSGRTARQFIDCLVAELKPNSTK
jgi:predicted AAA+ superfamily ATPase